MHSRRVLIWRKRPESKRQAKKRTNGLKRTENPMVCELVQLLFNKCLTSSLDCSPSSELHLQHLLHFNCHESLWLSKNHSDIQWVGKARWGHWKASRDVEQWWIVDGCAHSSTLTFRILFLTFAQTPMQARTEAAIKHVKNEQAKIKMQQLAFEAGLLDPELVFRSIGFTNFLSTWLIRQADPRKTHPNPTVEYVLNARLSRFSWLMIDSQATSSQGSTYVFQSAPRIHRGGHRRLSLLRCAVSDW